MEILVKTIGPTIKRGPSGFFETVDGKQVLVAPPLKFLAKGFQEDGSGNFHEVSFKGPTGEIRKTSIPHSLIAGDSRQALKILADAGYPLPRSPAVQQAILGWFMAAYASCSRTVTVRSATGWHNADGFLLGSIEVPGSARGLRLIPSLAIPAGDFEVRGTLLGWQQEVAIPACQSKFMMLAVLVALAAPLARFLGAASGGINISGPPGAGKTATLQVGASVYGAVPSWSTWDVSDHGPGTLAQSHNDLPLFLDELGALERRGSAGAELLARHIYRLCGGVARVTSHRAATAPDQKVDTTTLFISTSETAIPDLLRTIRGPLPEGVHTRLFDIPLDPASTSGVFDAPGFQHSGKQFAVEAGAIWAATERHMGVAGRKYLRRLIQAMQKDKAGLLRRLGEKIELWKAKSLHLFDPATDPRIIHRLALLYAAGRLAAEWGILPPAFARAQGPALQRCLASALRPTPGQSAGIALVERLRAALDGHGAITARGAGASGGTLGYSRSGPGVTVELLLRKAAVEQLFGHDKDDLMTELRARNALKLDTRGSNYHRHRVPGRRGELESVLIIRPDRLE